MGTVFVLTHIFIFCLLLTGLFYLLRNKGRCAMRFSNYLRNKFLWNFMSVFIMEAYFEIALSSVSVLKRC